MTYVVTENCIKCVHQDCVAVCPVDCFYIGPNFMTIDPDECIDCAVCVPECPVDAIVADNELETKDFDYWLQKNKELAEKWPVITKSKDPLPEAEEYKDIEDKKDLLEE